MSDLKKIDVFIAGAAKSATTSLLNYLGQCPRIKKHKLPEFTYFADPEEYARGYTDAFEKYFAREDVKESDFLLAKHAMLMYTEGAIERMLQHNPKMKIIVLLRDPVKRSFSGYIDTYRRGLKKEPYEDTINKALRKRHYKEGHLFPYDQYHSLQPNLNMGEYAPYISQLMAKVSPENIRVLLYEDLASFPTDVVKEITDWLGLEESPLVETEKAYNVGGMPRSRKFAVFINSATSFFRRRKLLKRWAKKIVPPDFFHGIQKRLYKLNSSSVRKPAIPVEMAEKLYDHFEPFNLTLAEMINRDLNEWRPK